MEPTTEVAKTVDATGLACPMPLVRTRQGMDTIESGEILRVMSTDRGSLGDLPAWADAMGHEILRIDEGDGVITFDIRKA
jgi:tRNA 2-thiouridine synthesizing protein A